MTNEFFHGVQGFITRVEGKPVKAVRSSVIGAIITAGKGPVNVPTLVFGNLTAASNLFGPFLHDGFTAGMTFKGIFEQIGTMVLAVNVCDPDHHNSDIAGEVVSLNRITGKGNAAKRYFVGDAVVSSTISGPATLTVPEYATPGNTFTLPTGAAFVSIKDKKGGNALVAGGAAGQYSIAGGVITVNGAANTGKTFWVTYTLAVVKDVDYTVNGDLGQFTRLNTSSKIIPSADITVSYTYVDPSKVTAADIIGAPADGDTPAKGIYALRAAPTTAGVLTKAKLLIAPKFSHLIAVGQALNNASSVLGGRCFLDTDNSTPGAAVDYAQNFAGELDRVNVHYPDYLISHPTVPNDNIQAFASIYLAGSQARTDKNDGKGDPYVSLSNKPLKGINGLMRPVDHTVTNLNESGGESTQQWLNSQNVMTTIREDGWRAYGNTQCNGEFLCVQRMADYVIESSVLALLWAIDKNINGSALLDQMLTVERQFLRALEARGALVANPNPEEDNDVWFPAELNTSDQIAQGHAYLNFRMNPPPPLQRLTVTGELTHEFVKQLFQAA